ncbi:hypothetical protein TSUD_153470 [Trifolium subterraneum]|uniref:Uncharacterized protein n=1 Tax=Trifolium subterraneum TaxID=3900 RepID=A0A2Z6PFU1_TRISU|nr:hypothetical protein TSUD_153470 [Trifolium subterraneum]
MEQGEGRSQERVEGQGKGKKDGSSSMQGVVNQGGRSQEVAEGQGREFERLVVGEGTTNASAGGTQPSGDGCA